MCIIVDANRLGIFLRDPPDEDAAPIHKWLSAGRGSIVYSDGGGFTKEVQGRARERLLQYSRAGTARFVPKEQFVDDQNALQGRTRSDDPHVLAPARAAGVRLLYTGDAKLMADFKNRELIRGPRGKVYSGAANAGLLTRSACAR